jgi:2-polyprenyl-3-methyl-5-hydroxy-6-metoxy-1,4-benzoquinol methylase
MNVYNGTELTIQDLGPWWEDIDIDGVSTRSLFPKAGRKKSLLFSELFDKVLPDDYFLGKSVVDLGCNCGGSILEMLKRGASKVYGVEGHDQFFRQLKFVIDKSPFQKERVALMKYNLSHKNAQELAENIGSFDIGFCIGLIYHMNRSDVIEVMRYLRENTGSCIFSSPVTSVGRSVDWNVTREGIDELLDSAGYSDKRILLDTMPGDEKWTWMTNTYYFEAIN